MSGKLIVRVLDSSLRPAPLKLVAIALARYADDDGGSIFPSVARLASVLGVTRRAVQTQLTRLERAGVLTALTPRSGGRGRTTSYRLNADALLPHPAYKPRRGLHGLDPENLEAGFVVTQPERVKTATETMKSTAERVKSTTENLEAGFTRSVSDLPVDQSVDQSEKICAPDGAPVSHPKTESQSPERKFSNILDILRTTDPALARRWDEGTARTTHT